MKVEWNPSSREFQRDPYPWYRRLREHDPVHRRPMRLRGYATFVTRHSDVQKVLRDKRFTAERLRRAKQNRATPERQRKMHPLTRIHLGFMLFRDPPEHTRLRKLVEHAFSPALVQKMRSHCLEATHRLLDDLQHSDQPDLIFHVAAKLPVSMILAVLGIPPELREQFEKLSGEIAKILDPTTRVQSWFKVMVSATELQETVTRMIAERRESPRDDLVSWLVVARDQGDMLLDEEIVGTVFLLMAAGHETTRNLFGNGSLALIRHPEERDRLRSDPQLLRTAVDELLRYDAPVQMTVRTALEDLEIRGHEVARGQEVYTLLGSANRDPEVFDDPDRLDLGRRRNRHVSFSSGVHYCLGAGLARMEGEILFDALVQRFPNLELAVPSKQLEWCEGFVLRGLRALPVRW